MTSAVLERDTLMPRPPDGIGPGLVLALVAHLALVIALAFAVHWRASEPEGVEAELWAAVPQIAAPRAVEPEPAIKPEPPPPPPQQPVEKTEPQPDPQIAIEKAKREAAERKKQEEADQLVEKRKQEQEDKRRKEQEQQRQ